MHLVKKVAEAICGYGYLRLLGKAARSDTGSQQLHWRKVDDDDDDQTRFDLRLQDSC